jgi:hypothetical protein
MTINFAKMCVYRICADELFYCNVALNSLHEHLRTTFSCNIDLPKRHYCAIFIVFVQMIVTCPSKTHTECIVALPLQKWLGERARKVIRT